MGSLEYPSSAQPAQGCRDGCPGRDFEFSSSCVNNARMEQAFRHVYQHNVWGDPESVSGPGSGLLRTEAFRDQIADLLSELGAKSLLDAGCGDFNWMRAVRLPVERYVGIDIVPELIRDVQHRYADDQRTFIHGDIVRDNLERVDVILCRDCLVHFSLVDALAAVRNFKRSGSRYMLTTSFIAFGENVDIETGEWRRLNLERPPFDFPPPEKAIDEKCLHTGGIYADKRLALWRLDAIPE
jgi:SAM-dependent methyltransferase